MGIDVTKDTEFFDVKEDTKIYYAGTSQVLLKGTKYPLNSDVINKNKSVFSLHDNDNVEITPICAFECLFDKA